MLGSAYALNPRSKSKDICKTCFTKLNFSVANTAHTDSGTYKCLGSNTVNSEEQGSQAKIIVAVGKDIFLGTI